MASKQVRGRVENAYKNGRGNTIETLQTLQQEYEEIAEDEEENGETRTAARLNAAYVQGHLQTPGPFMTDLNYIKEKTQRRINRLGGTYA
jgi:hypothetical protein